MQYNERGSFNTWAPQGLQEVFHSQRMHSYCRGRTVPTRPWASGEHTTQTRPYRGTITEDDTGNEPLPKAGMSLFCVWGYRSLRVGLPTAWSFLHLAQGAFKLPGDGPEEQDTHPKEKSIEVVARVISYPEVALETGPTVRWVGPETLVDVVLEGCGLLALADSGSQVNTMMPEFVQAQGYPVLLLDKLVDYPLN